MRLEQKSFAEISRALGISAKTISRWENGYRDSAGHWHAGWRPRLEERWKEMIEADLQYGLMKKEERLKAMEKTARLLINRANALLPSVKVKNAADIKLLVSEARELLKLIKVELGEATKGPDTLVAVKADITLNELRERFAQARADEAEYREFLEGTADDGSDCQERGGAEGRPGVVEDD